MGKTIHYGKWSDIKYFFVLFASVCRIYVYYIEEGKLYNKEHVVSFYALIFSEICNAS